MSRQRFYILVLIVSVIGLFIVQYQYLNVGVNLAQLQFQKKIGAAAQQIKADLATENQLTFLVGKAITLDDTYFTLSMDSVQDASRHFLNDFVTHRLTENGIDTDFSFRLFTKDTSDYLTGPTSYSEDEKLIKYPVELEGYLPNLIDKNLILELQFKDLNSYFLFQLNGLTIPSLLFIGGILFVVIWVLRSFYWQRNVITTTNDFINNLTHELKTPVFSIGLASKILDEKVAESEKPVVKLIQQQTERLKNHIDKVLELSELESKKEILTLKKVDFRPYLGKLCEEFELLATVTSITFNYKIDGDNYPISAEVSHLENAINNLLDNAKKYAENPIISLHAEKRNNQLAIVIEDNGIGMSSEDVSKVFQKYYRVHQNNHKVKGYGLGLSYVKEILKRHKGTIDVKSEVNKGTQITLQIPLIHE